MSEISKRLARLTPKQRTLLAMKEMRAKLEADEHKSAEPIAVVGIGCRFPGGANDPESFWQLLHDGVDVISEVPADRWNVEEFYEPDLSCSGTMNTRWGGFLERVDLFDPYFFGISTREAASMDPQQRLLLEVTWEALENAGQAAERLAQSQVGVFVGASSWDYSTLLLEPPQRGGTGVALSIMANRLSYFFDFRGPSMVVDTACSSSLVVVDLACQSLRNGSIDMAVAGGVNIILLPHTTVAISQAGMMAPDGRCKTFDIAADGYVRSEGCGMIVLKRLSDALSNRDNIIGLLRGSAVHQDGRSNGLTAPQGLAQQAVIRQALRQARLAPEQIGYIEAHGTGTSLGDTVEVASLASVLEEGRSPDQRCLVGSVKTNIGHLEAAAGIAGLIKVLLALQHEEIPRHIHLNQFNPNLNIEKTPLEVVTEPRSWQRSSKPRYAGVSSFGFGGTIAHVIVEEAPVRSAAALADDRPLHLITLSARTEQGLKEIASRYDSYLESQLPQNIADIGFTTNTGRNHFAHRLAVAVESVATLRAHLKALGAGETPKAIHQGNVKSEQRPKLAFLFAGQGSQYAGMGQQLFQTQPTFRRTLEQCAELFAHFLERPLLSVIYPEAKESANVSDVLNETLYAQAALFSLEYALSRMWSTWGIEPDAVFGHSIGGYVAACVAGVMTLEDAIRLVGRRAQLMQSLPSDGMMVMVSAEVEQVSEAIDGNRDRVSIAAINGAQSVVISGDTQVVRQVIESLESRYIFTQPLKVSHAFHSPLMDGILDAFEQTAEEVNFAAPRVPFISDLTGRMLEPDEVPGASYWRQQMRQPVLFAAGNQTLRSLGYELFLEIGPSSTLANMSKRCFPKGQGHWLTSLKPGVEPWQTLLDSIAALYVRGFDIDWIGFDREYSRTRLALPTYPFERKRCWLEPSELRSLTGPLKERTVSYAGGN